MTVTPFSLAAAPSTVAGVCHDVRRMLSQNLNDELAFTAEAYVPGSGKLKLKSIPKRVGDGSLLSYGESTLYVVSKQPNSTEVEVMPGYDGGADVAIPANAPLRVNPRFTDNTIFQSVRSAVAAMASPTNGLFGTAVQYTVGMLTDDYYPFPEQYAEKVGRVLQVSERSSSSRDWVRITDYAVTMTAGNRHLRIFTDALQYEIVYGLDLEKPQTFTADLVADCYLSESMLDIPALGAASVLMYGQEARRVNQRAQGDPRRSEDVPITGSTGAARDLRRVFEQRIDEEHVRLLSDYPYRMN